MYAACTPLPPGLSSAPRKWHHNPVKHIMRLLSLLQRDEFVRRSTLPLQAMAQEEADAVAALMAAASGDVRSEAEQVLGEEGSPPREPSSAPASCKASAMQCALLLERHTGCRQMQDLQYPTGSKLCLLLHQLLHDTDGDKSGFLLQLRQQRRQSSW